MGIDPTIPLSLPIRYYAFFYEVLTLIAALFIIGAYLIGSISSAILVCKIWGLPDPRTQGSHNPGATNVLRIGGRVPALLTLCGDVLKGILPVALARWYGFNPEVIAAVGLAAFIGHLYPVFFRFIGGKGVATAIGVWLAISWQVALVFLLIWLIVVALLRYVSLASMIASLVVPFYMWYVHMPVAYIYLASAIAIIIVFRHRDNLLKIVQGKENKLF